MEKLNNDVLKVLPNEIVTPLYDRQEQSASIVHFGTGNFHRAHQATYCEDLLNLGETKWGIIGVSLRSADVKDRLAPQNYLYTQSTLSEQTTHQIIGAILDILVAPSQTKEVVQIVAKPNTQVITTTITEKGYCLKQGKLDHEHPSIASDIHSLDAPQSIYGFLAAGLLARFNQSQAPLTIVCCDNISSGGELLKAGVERLLASQSSAFFEWCNAHVSFCSSMVDRVTPATSDSHKTDVANAIGFIDTAPVAAEPFKQWVIEDKFKSERPPFDKVGALFVDDVAPYEKVKLRFLNASHSILACLGYLAGDQFIHEAIARSPFSDFSYQTLIQDVLPATHIPNGIDAHKYVDDVFMRFENAYLPYACLQVGTDSSQKIQQRWFPSIDDALNKNQSGKFLSFAVAVWLVFIRKAMLANDLRDPLLDKFLDFKSIDQFQDVDNFLRLAGAEQFEFFHDESFMEQIKQDHHLVVNADIEQVVKQFIRNI